MDERDERWARSLYLGLCEGLIVWHLRMAPEERLDALVAYIRVLAQEGGVRLVVKRELEAGKVRYRLRRRREDE